MKSLRVSCILILSTLLYLKGLNKGFHKWWMPFGWFVFLADYEWIIVFSWGFPKVLLDGAMTGRTTWIIEQHNQIKRCVSILSSEVDISTLIQQVLDNVFIAEWRAEEKTKDSVRNDTCSVYDFASQTSWY